MSETWEEQRARLDRMSRAVGLGAADRAAIAAALAEVRHLELYRDELLARWKGVVERAEKAEAQLAEAHRQLDLASRLHHVEREASKRELAEARRLLERVDADGVSIKLQELIRVFLSAQEPKERA